MKGIALHWDSPWKDIYSGIDPHADAWVMLADAFDYELVAIAPYWPFPPRYKVKVYKSMDEFLESVKGQKVALADYKEPGEPNPDLKKIDWLVFGPADGWAGAHPDIEKWCYRPSTPNGYFAVHLAYIAAHMGREVD